MLFISCVCHAFASVPCCLGSSWDVHCDFVILPFGILGQVWYWRRFAFRSLFCFSLLVIRSNGIKAGIHIIVRIFVQDPELRHRFSNVQVPILTS